jgi:hypothetical protein
MEYPAERDILSAGLGLGYHAGRNKKGMHGLHLVDVIGLIQFCFLGGKLHPDV